MSRAIQFLKNLGQLRFSGQLVQSDPTGQQWIFYWSQGSIIYATGGTHPVRRWHRSLAVHCPQKAAHRIAWYFDLGSIDSPTFPLGWEYALLNLWISRQEMTREQADRVIQSVVAEVLFDIAQTTDVTDQIRQDSSLSTQFSLISAEEAIAKAQMDWQTWQNAKLTGYLPNRSPVIRQPEKLRSYSSAQFSQTLIHLLNGQRTLRDLAVQMRRDVVEVAASLLPFMRLEWIELTQIADLPTPVRRRSMLEPPPKSNSTTTAVATVPPKPALAPAPTKKTLIACVDDSLLVRHMMEKLLTSAGYQFLGVDDALRAIGILLARKPDLIFLDLMMPNANGHEICAQLRKLSCFRHTPIVILTGSDGFANRLRSNFVGASEFLSKPLDAEAVLGVIRKHLEHQDAASLSAVTDY